MKFKPTKLVSSVESFAETLGILWTSCLVLTLKYIYIYTSLFFTSCMLFWQNTRFSEDRAMTVEASVRKRCSRCRESCSFTEKLKLSLRNNILVKGRTVRCLIANDFAIKISAFGLQQGPRPARIFHTHSIYPLFRRGTAYQRHRAVDPVSAKALG